MRLKRTRLVLAVLSCTGGDPWSPAQLQKIFYALDHRAATELGGPFWDFAMYHHGPFDSAVYSDLETLQQEGFVRLGGGSLGKNRTYSLTPSGQEEGGAELRRLSMALRIYVGRLSEWVCRLSFRDLAQAGPDDFPSM